MKLVLHDYWRSSAAYRVRIALGLLGLPYERVHVNLLTGAHRGDGYRELNPQGLVPTLVADGRPMTQSLAIIEYLAALHPGAGLLSDDPDEAYRIRRIAHAIAMEIHPVCNLRVVTHVAELAGGGDETKAAWMRTYIREGLVAVEAMLREGDSFCVGDRPTMADCCLVPQIYNAERWGVPIGDLARIGGVVERCGELGPFRSAHPEAVGPPPP